MRSRLLKPVLVVSSLSVSALAGDCYDVRDRFVYPIYYNESLIAEGFYKRPFNLHKQYKLNEEGYLEVYFGDKEMYPVDENLRVNERNLTERLKDGLGDLVKQGSNSISKFMDYLEGDPDER